MKVVVLSDTHINGTVDKVPERLERELGTADRIIHAGDWNSKETADYLRAYGRLDGVHGNVDDEYIKKLYPEKQIVTLGRFKTGLIHGHGKGKTTEKRVLDAFSGQLDCIIFGHSHIPYLRYHNKTLLFNPGSCTNKRKMPMYSFGILTITDTIKAEFIFFK